MQSIAARIERTAILLGGVPFARGAAPELGRLVLSLPDGSPLGVEELATALRDRDRETLDEFQKQVGEIRAGKVRVLGYGVVATGCPPAWHRDGISGHEAPRIHWSRVPYLDVGVVGDHKIVWEPNRHQYLFAPALSWLTYGRLADFELVQQHLRDWLAQNPARLGINWASSLELAYRSITWCWLLRVLHSAPWDPLLVAALGRSLQDHARHIERYLSTYFSPNTHLTGEALGLFYAGTVLVGAPRANRWRALGAKILEEMLERHVRPDGTYFEQATLYHRYTAEIYLHYLRLAESTSHPVGPKLRPALHALFGFLRTVADARGRIPLLGDDDGGLLLPLDHRPPDDVRGLLLAGAVALDRPEFVVPDSPAVLAVALNGLESTLAMLNTGPTTPAWKDRSFDDGGFFVFRDGWGPNASVGVLDAGPHGAMNCAHSHADALSLTVTLGACPLFVDRGTLTYTGRQRDEFRSTVSHNTVEIDDEPSAIPSGPFAWRNVPPRPTVRSGVSGGVRWVAASAVGHIGSGRPSIHDRVVLNHPSGPWIIIDRAVRKGMKKAVARWYLHPDLDVQLQGNRVATVVMQGTQGGVASVAFPGQAETRVENRDASQRLGERRPCKVLAADADPLGTVVTLVSPGRRGWQAGGAAGHFWVTSDSGVRHDIALRPRDKEYWRPFDLESDALLAWRLEGRLDSGSRGDAVRVCLVGATRATGAATAEAPMTSVDALLFDWSDEGWSLVDSEAFDGGAK